MTDSSDWEDRHLCDDGACIGVIGPDGRCKACGKAAAFWGDERRRGQRTDEAVDEAEAAVEEDRAHATVPEAPDGFDDRRLCPDGACIGVLGDDGRCKVCGATDDPAPPPAA